MAKEFFGKYGKVGVATFLSAAIINYSLVYVAVKKGVNLRELADRVGYQTTEERWHYIETLGPATAAYVIYKAMAPLRWPFVIGATPLIVRALSRK